MRITSIAFALLITIGVYSQNEFPQSVINSLHILDDGKSLPNPEFINKNTQLKIQVVDYDPEWNYDIRIESNIHLFFDGDGKINGNISDDGTFEASFNLQIAQYIYVEIEGFPLRVFLSPEKESKVYLNFNRYAQDRNAQYAFFSGENAEINNQMNSSEMMALDRKDYYDFDNLKGMSKELFREHMYEKMHEKIADLQKIDNLSKKTLEFATANIEVFTATIMLEVNNFILSPEEKSNKSSVVDVSYYTYLRSFDLNNRKYAYFPFYSALFFNLFSAVQDGTKESLEQVKEWIGHEDGYAIDILKAKIIANGLTGIEPIEEKFMIEMMSSIKEPHYSEYLTNINNVLKESFKTSTKLLEDIEVKKTDEISIDEIVKRNKGKIIFIDFWATWCGPCMADIRKSKFKKEEYAKEGVRFIYLTDESSPIQSWRNVKENVTGEHYRLSTEKMKEITEVYNIKFYPSYLIFNKAGELLYQTIAPKNILSLMDIINDELKQ